MNSRNKIPENIDEYISLFPSEIQVILQKIRLIVQENAPDPRETISYKMPAFKLDGILLYFAAFKNHIGIYPPIQGDPKLLNALSPYVGPKGNLKFPLNQPMRYDLIEKIVRLRVKQNLAKTTIKSKK